jgi:hypothetical protein
MGILGRTGNTYARLKFNTGPGGSLNLPVTVNWTAWPMLAPELAQQVASWEQEYCMLVQPVPHFLHEILCLKAADDWLHDPFLPGDIHAFE